MSQAPISCDEVRGGMCASSDSLIQFLNCQGENKSFLSYFFHLLVISKTLYSYSLLQTFNAVFVVFIFSLPVLHVHFVNLPGGAFSCNPGFYIQRKCKYLMVGNLWTPMGLYRAGAEC